MSIAMAAARAAAGDRGHDDDGGGGGETIKVFLRLKPSNRPSPYIKVAGGGRPDEGKQGEKEAALPRVRVALDWCVIWLFAATPTLILVFSTKRTPSGWLLTCPRPTPRRWAATSTTTRRTINSPLTASLTWAMMM